MSINYGNMTSNIKNIILSKMRQYGMQSSLFTTLWIIRMSLLTKERAKSANEGKLKNEEYWQEYKESINDDLESFFNRTVNQEEFEEDILSFMTPMLTREDSKLVYEKDEDFIKKFFYGSYDPFFKEKSDSKNVYAHDRCFRETMRLSLGDEMLENSSGIFYEEDSSLGYQNVEKTPETIQPRQRKGVFKKIQSFFRNKK